MPEDFVTFPDAAELLGIGITAVHQHIKDGHLIATRNADGVRVLPAGMIHGGVIVKSLPAVITLLRDARYSDEEIVDWLGRADDSLPGTPLQALQENRGTEVKRRAQAAGF